MKKEARGHRDDVRKRVRQLADPLQELINSLPADVRPDDQEEYMVEGSEMGIDFTDRWDSGPPWPGEWNNKG